MNRTSFLVGYKVIFGLLSFSAVITEVVVTLSRGTFMPGNFFSYFTIESNIFAAGVLVISAYATVQARRSQLLSSARGAATLYMVITGLVFAILLSGIKGAHFTAVPRDNVILHYIMPVVILLDWVVDTAQPSVTFRRGLRWIIYPLVYVGYTLVRGRITRWYPYPFLNPSPHGYIPVAITCAIIAVVSVGIMYVLTRVTGTKSIPRRFKPDNSSQ
jgi:hypothetical protein